MVAQMGRFSESITWSSLPFFANDASSVMSFVGYDYQKQKERQPSGEWTSIMEEEFPDGDDF